MAENSINEDEVELPNIEEFEDAAVVEESQNLQPTMEDKAKEMGWVPKEQFEGDPDTWVDAKEFVGRAPLYEAIHKNNRKVKQLEEAAAAFKEYQRTLVENTRKQALKEYQEKLNTAAEMNDVKGAIQAQKEIDKLESESAVDSTVTETKKTPEPVKEAFERWEQKNPWYTQDKRLRFIATGYGYEIREERPELSYEEVLEEVTKQMEKEFPEKFSNPAKKRPAVVAKTTTASAAKQDKSKATYAQLPDEVKSIYRRLVKTPSNMHGHLSHEEFMTDYIASGGSLES